MAIPNKISPIKLFILETRPTTNMMTTPMIMMIRMVATSLPMPTLDMSPIASPTAKASPNLSVFANLHLAMKFAKANTINKIMLIMVKIQSLRKSPKIKVMTAGMR